MGIFFSAGRILFKAGQMAFNAACCCLGGRTGCSCPTPRCTRYWIAFDYKIVTTTGGTCTGKITSLCPNPSGFNHAVVKVLQSTPCVWALETWEVHPSPNDCGLDSIILDLVNVDPCHWRIAFGINFTSGTPYIGGIVTSEVGKTPSDGVYIPDPVVTCMSADGNVHSNEVTIKNIVVTCAD